MVSRDTPTLASATLSVININIIVPDILDIIIVILIKEKISNIIISKIINKIITWNQTDLNRYR